MKPVGSVDPTDKASATRRSTWVSGVVNAALTAGQVVVGTLTGSQALIADALHSLSDLVSDLVVWVATTLSRRAPDGDHHYGHHRYENAATLVLGGLLLAVGLGMGWNAVRVLAEPEAVGPVHSLALWVALGTLVCKELLFRYLLSVAQRVRSSLLVANAWHARSDAASSLVVAVGIGGNLLGYPVFDPIAALVVGLMVVRMGARFAWDALHDLLDRAATAEDIGRIRADMLSVPGVQGLHDLKTRRAGDLIIVDVHLEVNAHMTVAEGHAIALAVRNRVLERHPVLSVMTHLDPV